MDYYICQKDLFIYNHQKLIWIGDLEVENTIIRINCLKPRVNSYVQLIYMSIEKIKTVATTNYFTYYTFSLLFT